jgi:opacity protein-like surface antigen
VRGGGGSSSCLLDHRVTPKRIAVLTLKNKLGSYQNETNYLTAMIRGEVARSLSETYLVMTEENIASLLPTDKPLEDCVSDCQITLGREIGASYIITGELVRFGQSLRLFIRLHNTHSGRLMANEIAKASTLESLENPTQDAVTRLLDQLTKKSNTNPKEIPKTLVVKKVSEPTSVTDSQPKLEQKTSHPNLSETQSQTDSKWSFEGDLGVTQIDFDEINQISFGLGFKRTLADHFHLSLNLHYGALSDDYFIDYENTNYDVEYVSFLPAFGVRFVRDALTFHTEFGLGFAFGSANIETYSPTSSTNSSSGFNSLALMLGGGTLYQLTQTMSISLNLRYLSINISELVVPNFLQSTIGFSWKL